MRSMRTSLAKNHCNGKIDLLSNLIQLNSFVIKKKFFWPPTQKFGYGSVEILNFLFIIIKLNNFVAFYCVNNFFPL